MYDILFSKEALQLADKANAFKALMIQTALESLEENGKTKLKNAQGKYDYTILKNMLYKGKIVRPHRMKKELPEKKHKDEAAKAEKKPALAKREPAPKQPEDPSKPKVTFVHRGDLDFAACLGSAGSMDQPITRRPKELLVRLELPKLQSAADMELDIKGSFLEFSVPGTYQLKQKLPFPVDEASGDAKYNKTQKVLTVTLTVLPWTKEEAMEELQLAAKAREEAERKAREAEEARRLREAADAKRVVKRGFLAGAAERREAPGGAAGGGDAGVSEEGGEAAGGAGAGAAPAAPDAHRPPERRALIEDLGEVPAAGAGAAPASAEALAAEEAVEEVAGGEPAVSFRQNQATVTAVVRVEHIDPRSLAVEVGPTRVTLAFRARAGPGRAARYSHTLHLARDVEPSQSRHDLGEANLVLILRKASPGERWDALVGAPREPKAPEPSAPAETRKESPAAAVPDVKAAEAGAPEAGATKKKKGVRWGDNSTAPEGGAGLEHGPSGSGAATAPAPASAAAGSGDGEGGEHADGRRFEAAERYDGPRAGMVFQQGPRGLGYYQDKDRAPAPATPAAAAPAPAPAPAPAAPEVLSSSEVAARGAVGDGPAVARGSHMAFRNNLIYELE